jgi:hypothetical protein
MDLLYYDLSDHACGSDQLDEHLRRFRSELAKDIGEFATLTIRNGQEVSPGAYRFISDLLQPTRSEIDFDVINDRLWKAREGEFGNAISRVLDSKTFICVTGGRFKQSGGAYHGLTAPNFFAVVVESYRGIVWHEAAHLFGADDHYRSENPGEMKQQCTNKVSCVMRYEPGGIFCTEAVREIRNGMSTLPRRPLSFRDFGK